jgi:hypothetical protein
VRQRLAGLAQRLIYCLCGGQGAVFGRWVTEAVDPFLMMMMARG